MTGCNEADVVWVEPPYANDGCIDATSSYFDEKGGQLYLVCYWACAYPPEQMEINEPSEVWLWIRWDDGAMIWDVEAGCAL